MELIRHRPGSVDEQAVLAVSPEAPTSTTFTTEVEAEDDTTWGDRWDAAVAGFQRHNTIVSTATRLANSTDTDVPDPINPFEVMQDDPEFGDEFMNKYRNSIESGDFDGAVSKDAIHQTAARLDAEQKLIEDEALSAPAMLTGAIAAALADPTSYVPVAGQLVRGSKLLRTMGRMRAGATAGVISAGAAEAILQSTQDLRTMEESIMGIGTAGILGGGIGALVKARVRGNDLHPESPNNPLRTENLDDAETIIRVPGEDVEVRVSPEGVHEVHQTGESTVGAARNDVAGNPDTSTRAGETGRAGQVIDTISQATIVGRAWHRTSSVARNALFSLMDNGGAITRANQQGVGTRASAENLAAVHRSRAEKVMLSGDQIFRDLKRTLGLAKFSIKRSMELDKDWREVARRLLRGTLDENDPVVQSLKGKYGDQWEAIRTAANDFAEEVHNGNAYFEEQLVKLGFVQDSAKLDRLAAELGKLKAEVTRLKAEGADKGTLEGPRASRDDLKREYDAELSKPAPMGRDYGVAQVWDRSAILTHPEKFKAFLTRILGKNPDENWLQESYGLSRDDLMALKDSDPDKYQEIIEEWAGDSFGYSIREAEVAVAAAERAQKQAELDLNDILRQEKALHRREGQLTLSAARKRRDKLNGEAEAMRRLRETLRGEQRALTEAAVAARQTGVDRQLELTVDGVAPKRPSATPQAAKAAERARAVADELKSLDARLKAASERLGRLDEALNKADQKLADVQASKAAVKQAKAAAKEAAKDAAKASRKASKASKRAHGKHPLDDYVQEIFEALSTGRRIPANIFDRRVPLNGRMKARQLDLTPEERLEAEAVLDGSGSSFLKTDLSAILVNQYEALAGQLGIREALDGKSWDQVLSEVEDSYARLIAAETDEVKRAKLAEESKDAIKDMEMVKDRLLRTEDDGDAEGYFAWLSSKMRQWNFIMYGAGMGLSSIPDIATLAFRHPLKELSPHLKEVIHNMRHASDSEMAAMAHASEMGAHSVFSVTRGAMARFGDIDLLEPGNPFKSPTGSRVAANIDRAGNLLSGASTLISGLQYITRFGKTASAIMMSYRIRDLASKYGSLKQSDIDDLAAVGIGKPEAALIDAQIKKHGSTTSQGWFEPNLDRWDNSEALTAFRVAIQRDMNRAIVTPGVGDTPRLMSNWAARALMQFWTHSFAFMNRFMVPAIQKGKDSQTVQAWWLLFSATAVSVMLRESLKGRDPLKKLSNPLDFSLEVIDRSGILGWTSQYAMAGLKIGGVYSASRYENASAFSNLMGVQGALVENTLGLGDALLGVPNGATDFSDVQKKMRRLAPFKAVIDLSTNILPTN